MNKLTILITAAGNAYMPGICDAIKNNGEREIRLIGADMNKDDSILQMCDAYYQTPKATSPDYVDSLLEICKKEKVDILIPIMTIELEALSSSKEKFLENGTIISISDIEPLKIANNKYLLFDYMKKNNMNCPKYHLINAINDVDESIKEIGYPIVFKTLDDSGSRGFRIIDPSKSKFDLLFHEKPSSAYTTLKEFKETLQEGKFPAMMAMEYLPGEEYTVDLVVKNGEVKYGLCRRGLNVQTSIILDGIVEDRKDIVSMCSELASKLKLNGNIGFDVKENRDGVPMIMECNPRATAGVSEFVASNVNLLYLNIKQLLNENLPKIRPEYGVIMKRRYTEMYIKK